MALLTKLNQLCRHRWSGKYEAHLWDSTCRVEGRRRKGKQGMPLLFGASKGQLYTLYVCAVIYL